MIDILKIRFGYLLKELSLKDGKCQKQNQTIVSLLTERLLVRWLLLLKKHILLVIYL